MHRAHPHGASASGQPPRQPGRRTSGARSWAVVLAMLLVACGTPSPERSDTAPPTTSQARSQIAALLAAMRESQSHPERVLELGGEALELLARDPDDAEEAGVLSQVSFAHQRLGNLAAAIEHGQKARELAERAQALEQLAHASNSLAMAYQDLGEYPKAIAFVSEAIATSEKLGDHRGVLTALNTKAVIHAKQGDFHAALEAWVRALDMPEVSTLPRARHVFLQNIGNMYLNLDELDQALETYSQALTYARKLGDQGDIADLLHNMGTVFTERGEHEQASRHLAEALEILQESGNQRKLGSLYFSIGQSYERQGQNREALYDYRRAVELADVTGDRLHLVRSLLSAARVHLAENDPRQSLQVARRALPVAEELGLKVELPEAYALLSEGYERLGEPGQALAYHKLFKASHDQLFSAESSAKIAETLTRYETREKEREIDLLRSEAAIAELEVARQVTLRNALLAGLALLFTTLFLLTNRHRLKKETRRLREIDKLKDEFLANTSHELRTPLYGISGLSESLIDGVTGELPEATKANLAMIVSSARRLGHLVDDILDFSKLRHQSLELVRRPIDLRPLVGVVLSLSRSLVDGKDLELKNAIPEDLPYAHADENRLQQILHNLIGNAIKFTESGVVEVSARQEGGKLVVSVTDTGMGIPEDQREAIFDAFRQVDASTAREHGGTGLGLAVTRQLVELHGGRIKVESARSRGSVFSFTLPVASPSPTDSEAADTSAEPHETPPLAEATGSQEIVITTEPITGSPLILVVDDEPVVRQVLANHLAPEGYRLLAAAGGHEALRVLDEEPVDMVLLDVMMPRMSGYEVCRRIRQSRPREELPVLFLSAKTQDGDRVAGFREGANDYLSKPITKDELLARVHAHLELASLHRRQAEEVKTLRGLLPICCVCKKIRDDEGYWKHLEDYLTAHAEVVFSHGICPGCFEDHYHMKPQP